MHRVGFTMKIYHDARPYKRQNIKVCRNIVTFWKTIGNLLPDHTAS